VFLFSLFYFSFSPYRVAYLGRVFLRIYFGALMEKRDIIGCHGRPFVVLRRKGVLEFVRYIK